MQPWLVGEFNGGSHEAGLERTTLRKLGKTFESIPRVLHQTWKEPRIPEQWRPFQRSWLKKHPSWAYKLWTDVDNRRLIRRSYPWFLKTYDSFPRPIQRVDAVKYFILFTFGGVYADLDCECLQPVDPFLDPGGAILSRSKDGVIDGSFLASSPRHEFWKTVFSEIERTPRMVGLFQKVPQLAASHVLFSTGPHMLRRAVRQYEKQCMKGDASAGIIVYEPKYFSSRTWWNRYQRFTEPKAVLHHHYSDSWLLPSEIKIHKHFTTRKILLALSILVFLMVLFVSRIVV